MHQKQKKLIKAEKNLIKLVEIFMELSDQYELGTKDFKEMCSKYVELLQTMKKNIQPHIGFDWDKYEIENKATIDIDRISTNVEETPESEIAKTFEMLTREQKVIKVDDLVEKSGLEHEAVEIWIDAQKRVGNLFEPKEGFIQKV